MKFEETALKAVHAALMAWHDEARRALDAAADESPANKKQSRWYLAEAVSAILGARSELIYAEAQLSAAESIKARTAPVAPVVEAPEYGSRACD